jgi:hypothetical protein
MRLSHRIVSIAAFTVVMLCATSAFAQYFASEERPGLIISTTTTTSALVGGVIVLTVVSVKKEPTAMLRRYLRSNETAVRAALATGGGPALRDVAGIFGVRDEERYRAFAQMARHQRDRWTRLAYDTGDVDHLVRLVRTTMQFDPRLRASL